MILSLSVIRPYLTLHDDKNVDFADSLIKVSVQNFYKLEHHTNFTIAQLLETLISIKLQKNVYK